uniref:RAB17, member RAS onco family n=1 Tax=Callithrix jacchus TaxID=9483 RepID=A0A8I3ZZN3_CALJA
MTWADHLLDQVLTPATLTLPQGMAQAHLSPQPSAAPSQPRVFKLVLLGSGSVGKSSLALRYVKNDFKSILPTVGCAFFTKVVDLGTSSLKLEIWDTAGQEKYHSVCHLYFRGANAAVLVYDITRKDSFHKAQQWLKDLQKELQPGEVLVMLVGNKTDLSEEREVTFEALQEEEGCRQPARGRASSRDHTLPLLVLAAQECQEMRPGREACRSAEGKEFADSHKLLFMETSAKLNHQVSEVFSAVARELLQRDNREGQAPRGDADVALNERPAQQAKCCGQYLCRPRLDGGPLSQAASGHRGSKDWKSPWSTATVERCLSPDLGGGAGLEPGLTCFWRCGEQARMEVAVPGRSTAITEHGVGPGLTPLGRAAGGSGFGSLPCSPGWKCGEAEFLSKE